MNDTGETLDSVTTYRTGFTTADDDVLVIVDEEGLTYRQVPPGAAVKVDQYDDYYDLDYVMGLDLRVVSAALGAIRIGAMGDKGGIDEAVLLWDTGEPGKDIGIEKQQANQA